MPTLELLIEGTDRAGPVLDGVDRKLGGLGSSSKLAAGAVAGLGGAAVGGALGLLGQQTLELDSAMASFAGTAGLTQEQTKDLSGAVVDLSESSLQSQTAIAGAMEALVTTQGVSADSKEELAGLTQQYLDFATVTGTEAATAVASFDDVLDAWGLTAADAGGIMDALTLSHQKFGTDANGALEALNKMAPAFQTIGLDQNDALGWINAFAASGIDAGSSSAAFTKALDALTDSTDAGGQKLTGIATSLGITGEELASLRAQGPEAVFQRFASAIGSTEDPSKRAQAAIELFGSKAGPKLAETLFATGGDLSQFEVDVAAAGGATEDAAGQIEGSFQNRLKLLKADILGSAQSLTADFAPALMVMGTIGPQAGGAIGGVTAALGVVGPAARGAALAMSSALLTPPVGVFVLIAIALAALYLAFSTNLFGIRDFTEKTFGAIKDFLTENWAEIATLASFLFLGPGGLVVMFATNAFGIRDFVIGAFTSLKDGVVGIFTDLKNFLTENWKEIVTVALTILFPPGGGLFALVTNSFGIRDTVVGIFAGIPGALLGLAGSFLNVGLSLGEALASGVKDGINAIFGAINRGIPNQISIKIGGQDLGPFGSVPETSVGIDLPDNPFPTLARGGVVTAPTLALLGEAGREIVAPEPTLRKIVGEETRGGVDSDRLAAAISSALEASLPRALAAAITRSPIMLRELNVVLDGEKIARSVNEKLGARADLMARGG